MADDLGRTAYSGCFAGLHVDAATQKLTIHATDTDRGQRLATEARAGVVGSVAGQVSVEVHKAKYSHAQLAADEPPFGEVAAADIAYQRSDAFGPRGGFETFSRIDDSPPYWGGALRRTGTGPCTSGFPMRRSDKRWMITAAHCVQRREMVLDSGYASN